MMLGKRDVGGRRRGQRQVGGPGEEGEGTPAEAGVRAGPCLPHARCTWLLCRLSGVSKGFLCFYSPSYDFYHDSE